MQLKIHCGCHSDSRGNTNGAQFQDERYGNGMRLVGTTNKDGEARCTVCGQVRKTGR